MTDRSTHDLLTHQGDTIKMREDGRAEGFLVRFTSPDELDLDGEFFGEDTYYGKSATLDVYYHHGQDPTLGKRVIGEATVKMLPAGVWLEAQLELRDEYERYVRDLIRAGKLGWSSGAPAHLVEKAPAGKGRKITRWPLVEASMTPTPAEYRNQVSLKSLHAALVPASDATSDVTTADTEGAEAEPRPTADRVSAKQASSTQPAPIMPDTQPAPQPAETPDIGALVSQAVVEGVKQAIKEMPTFSAPTSTEQKAAAPVPVTPAAPIEAPSYIPVLGDTEAKAFARWVKKGDLKAVSHLQTGETPAGPLITLMGDPSFKASNDTDMNVGTAADGGNAVPTGHYQNIIARRDEMAIAARVGVMEIPGKGTTVNVPFDNEADGEFISTAEAGAFDRDAPALGSKALTLVKYTKKIEISYELLEDEDSRLMAFLENFVGRGMAKTHNNLLITEVGTNGTSLKTFASATAIAAGEIEDIVFQDDLAEYLDSPSVAWVMRGSTFGDIVSITGNDRLYSETPTGSRRARTLEGFPVYFSQKADAIASTNKSVYFGDWSKVGVRNAPDLTFLRDPYSAANTGQLRLHYYFRTVYGVLIAEAIGYGEQTT